MSRRNLVLATRRSALALAQARAFARDLQKRWPELAVEELLVVTTGDKVTDVPLSQVGGKGLFTKEIEEALLARRADFAVHSCKDVPAELSRAFTIACTPRRADPRDVVVVKGGGKLADLPEGARVGTSSLRRAVQLSAVRPDLTVVPLRGNVDTRLRKLDSGELDAIVLARAGLLRLGLEGVAVDAVDPDTLIPAPGQGALAIECRADDADTRDILAALSDADTAIAVACERGVMESVGGNCNVPFGAYAVREGADLRLRAMLALGDGQSPRRLARVVPWPVDVAEAARQGRTFGRELLDADRA
jgi:hydroxymethylbilane synthase